MNIENPPRTERTLLIIGALLLIGSAIVYYVLPNFNFDFNKGDAAATTSVTLEPSSSVIFPGDSFTIFVRVNTSTSTISAAQVEVTLPQGLQSVSIEGGGFLPKVLSTGTTNNGVARITVGSDPTNPKKGSGIIAIISARAPNSTGTLNFTLTSNTQVAAIGETNNVVASLGQTTVIVTSTTTSPTATTTPTGTPTGLQLRIDGSLVSTRQQLDTFTFVATGVTPNRSITRWIRYASGQVQALPTRSADIFGMVTWPYRPDCSTPLGVHQVWFINDATGVKSNEVSEGVTRNTSCLNPTPSVTPGTFGLKEGDMISAAGTTDPDIYIINQYGFKRLFLNPIIFGFYGHLGGYQKVKPVPASTRDAFQTSLLFKNCETVDGKVYAVEVVGEDEGILHHVQMTETQALSEDPNFIKKTFCINDNEYYWYPKSSQPYTSLSQIPPYVRK